MIETLPLPTSDVCSAMAATTPEPRRRVRQWELVSLAGEGSLAQVYRARSGDGPADRPANYAVKMLRPCWEDDPAAVRLLQREALVAGSVSNVHVVPVLAASVLESPRLLVMPWLDGASLRDRLAADEDFDAPYVLWIARQVAEALDALHAAGWMHGDVTPGNIHVSPTGHVTLLDLSFARRRNEIGSAADRPIMGTCQYIAPEYLTSALRPDIRSDIYSLGVVLFKMFASRVPYPAADLAELATLQRQTSPPELIRLAPHMPREAAALVREMIAKEPLRRPQTPRELIDRLVSLEINAFSERAW